MADDLERASIADVTSESTDDKHPIDTGVGFGARPQSPLPIRAPRDVLPQSSGVPVAGQQEVDDDGPSTLLADADVGVEAIGGYRAEWRPSGGASDGVSDGTSDSYGAGASDWVVNDIKIGNRSQFTQPHSTAADGTVDQQTVDPITYPEDEPTEYFLGPAEPPPEPGVVTEVSDGTGDLPAATDTSKFEDVD